MNPNFLIHTMIYTSVPSVIDFNTSLYVLWICRSKHLTDVKKGYKVKKAQIFATSYVSASIFVLSDSNFSTVNPNSI